MGATIGAVIFLLLAVGGILGARLGMPKTIQGRYDEKKNYARTWVTIGAAAFVPIAIITFVASGFQSVPTKSVGVLTSFGKVMGTPYGPGSYWMVPWKTLNVVSDTIQSDSFLQANGSRQGSTYVPVADTYTNSGAKGFCLTVRLGGQQEGCADVQLQTQTNEAAIPDLFANFSSYGPNLTQDVDAFVVKRDLITVLNRDLGDYSPVEDVSAQLAACDLRQVTVCNTSAQSQFTKFDPRLKADLQAALGNEVTVKDVNLQYVHYNITTEQALEKIQNSYTETAVQTQQEQTNAAISAANKALVSQTTNLTPAQLEQECFSIVQTAEKDNYQLPLTWGNCTGGTTSQTPVIVNNGK